MREVPSVSAESKADDRRYGSAGHPVQANPGSHGLYNGVRGGDIELVAERGLAR
jgi:hypothetical protein